jgi:hypothetical protein
MVEGILTQKWRAQNGVKRICSFILQFLFLMAKSAPKLLIITV